MMLLRDEFEILAAKGNDLRIGHGSGELHDTVGMQARTGDVSPRPHIASVGLQSYVAWGFADRGHAGPGLNSAARFDDPASERFRNLAVIDNCRGGNMERAQAGGVRLHLAQLLARKQGEARHAVGRRAAMQLFQHRDFRLVPRYDDLPAFVVTDGIFVAELSKERAASRAGARL